MPTVSSKIPRTALVTGGGKRIGRAIALALAEDGWAVAVHYGRSRDDAEGLVREIVGKGGRAAALPADLRHEAEVIALLPQAARDLGTVGCLVNCAATFENDTALTATRESWDTHLETNLRAPFVLMQEFARALPPTRKAWW